MPAEEANAKQGRIRLTLVEEELRGGSAPFLERFARRLRDDQHEALLAYRNTLITLSQSGYRRALPPSQTPIAAEAIETLRAATRRKVDEAQLKKMRAELFSALPLLEERAAKAVLEANQRLKPARATLLAEHAERVLGRYTRLSAHHALAAICNTIDAFFEPERGLRVIADLAAARAYQNTGLGSARHEEFQLSALSQAEWELTRAGKKPEREELLPLAGQIFHEYLGGRFVAHQQAEASKLEEFARWALRL